MRLIIAILVLFLVVALARSFILNALALKRDIDTRFDDFRARLESEANSTVDLVLNSKAGDTSN